MTIRDEFNAKKRRVMQVSHAGFGVFVAGIGLSYIAPWLRILSMIGLAGFAVAWLTMAYSHFFVFKCPGCRANWGRLVFDSYGSAFEIDKRIKCCPYCGIDLDSKAVGKPPADTDLAT